VTDCRCSRSSYRYQIKSCKLIEHGFDLPSAPKFLVEFGNASTNTLEIKNVYSILAGLLSERSSDKTFSMVNKNDLNLIDKIHLQKYIYLLSLFINNEIEPSVFEHLFLQIRREDNYWLKGQFNERVSKILDTFFLDVDSYNPNDLFDPEDPFNINEIELKKRANETLDKLIIAVGRK
jgi:hypothetical protein